MHDHAGAYQVQRLMSMTTATQMHTLIEESNAVLICTPHHAHIDVIASAVVLKDILHAQGIATVDIVSDAFTPTAHTQVLNIPTEHIHATLPQLKQLVMNIPVGNVPIKNVSHTLDNGMLTITVDPEGVLDHTQIHTPRTEYAYDLIITLNTARLNALGNVFQSAPDFFYTTPVINLDFQAHNERYGHINRIAHTAHATSEIVYDLIQEWFDHPTHTKTHAELLLTGILSKTNGLKSSHVTPPLLEKVHTLVQHGADITTINKQLFQIHSLNTMKLWGRVLAKLQESEQHSLIWSTISYTDFIKSGTTPDDLPQVIHEFLTQYQKADLILLIWEYPERNIEATLVSTKSYNSLDILTSLAPHGRPDQAYVTLPDTHIIQAEQQLLNIINHHVTRE